MKLLLIEDDAILARGVAVGLGRRGYEVQRPPTALPGWRWPRPDAGPGDPRRDDARHGRLGGLPPAARAGQQTPVIMLTAKGTQADVIQGLTLGADDYIKKPFAMEELALRVEAVLRRARARETNADADADAIFDDGRLRIDLERRVVQRDGRPVHLTPTEFRLLACLVRQRGRPVTHAELLREVWGPGYADETANLAVYIRYLREKLEETPASPQYICTEWGIGYRFTEPLG